jgi:hypothetical protein
MAALLVKCGQGGRLFMESTMRCFASRFFSVILKLSAALAACIGCSSKQADKEKPQPIHWSAASSDYTAETPLPPNNKEGQ